MKVAAGVLVSMTGLSLSEEYTWWGYVDRTLCVVRAVGSAAIPRLRPGLARVSRRRPSSSVRPGKKPRRGAGVPRGARLRPRAAGLGKGATSLRWRWSRGSHRADSDRPG